MALSIHYTLTGTGWADCRIVSDDHDVTVTASYLSNALLSLAKAVLAITEGAQKAVASFEEEPGEYRWLFERTGQERVSVRILDFPNYIPSVPQGIPGIIPSKDDFPDDKGDCVFQAECSVHELVVALVFTMDELLQTHGKKGYREQWCLAPFPTRFYNKLRAWTLLNQRKAAQNG